MKYPLENGAYILLSYRREEKVNLLKKIAELRNSYPVVIFYFQDSTIDMINFKIFSEVLYDIQSKKDIKKVTILLNTFGGNGEAAEKLVKLFHETYENLETIVMKHALSAGTLICIGSNLILMTPLSELSPIDPQIELKKPDGSVDRFGALELESGLTRLGFGKGKELSESIIRELLQQYDITTVGFIERSIESTKEVAAEFLKKYSMNDKPDDIIDNALKKLTETSLFHAHRISVTEALNLGLNIEKITVDNDLYDKIFKLYNIYLEVETEFNQLTRLNVPYRLEFVGVETIDKAYCNNCLY